ncbi:NAD-dependent epimerase/dehydratase family protein [Aristophania vespae]|uniref:NAD-dependent epimerase/dehydratase family protein n=1 Tax=Aristophania vespae TaxID=2697033 RepID=A0A6P1NKQ5_9PROT|nr:NAD(P)-dependent oxidoreductase [Aristophania vespae]QHI96222.1 NAD-dependent epimerase/dehydratase family protein [Aristophania vespae]
MKILVAGATGTIGLPLIRALCALGYDVSAITRPKTEKACLKEIGVKTYAVNIFDRTEVQTAISAIRPNVIIDQMTHLPSDPADILSSIPLDTHLHKLGGQNLLEAAKLLNVRRYIMQSKGFYLDAPEDCLADEKASLSIQAPDIIGESCQVLADYENDVTQAPNLDGVILRYGFFYGPGTWYRPHSILAKQSCNEGSVIIGSGKAIWSFVHIDDAIAATIAALHAKPGTYNIVDDHPLPVRQWLPTFMQWINAPEPKKIDIQEARKTVSEAGIYFHLGLRGASNHLAKKHLGFKPRPLLWAGSN